MANANNDITMCRMVFIIINALEKLGFNITTSEFANSFTLNAKFEFRARGSRAKFGPEYKIIILKGKSK